MPRVASTLSDVHVRKLSFGVTAAGKLKAALHPVGGFAGLRLQVSPPSASNPKGAKSWIYKITIGGKRKEIGLGSYPEVSLKDARELARLKYEAIKSGLDPVAEQRAKKAALVAEQAQHITFAEYSKRFITKQAKEYKTTEQVRRLAQQLTEYVHPHIGHLFLKDIKREHIVQFLTPIWEEKNHTAQRALRYVRRILQQSIAEGKRTAANPAEWKGDLELSFPKASKIAPVKHHQYIEWPVLPEFIKKLADWKSVHTASEPITKCFAFMILTVARPSAARLANWDEIDLTNAVWTIPAGGERRKVTSDWQIPLTKEAVTLLKSLPSFTTQTGRLFGRLDGSEIPANTLPKLPRKLGYDCAAHGFRTTFRTWGQEQTRFTEEVLELCMTHKNNDATRAAYARSQLLDERRNVLAEYNTWAMQGKKDNNVTPIHRRRER
jgi:integrase